MTEYSPIKKAGGGLEQYKGDLGNSFLDFQEEWYGFVKLAYGRYLNHSFDAQAFATIGEIGRCFDGVLDPEHPVLMFRSRFTTEGFYTSINGGLGFYCQLIKNIQFVYNLELGYFTSDAIDFISKGSNDMYLQNTLKSGFNF